MEGRKREEGGREGRKGGREEGSKDERTSHISNFTFHDFQLLTAPKYFIVSTICYFER